MKSYYHLVIAVVLATTNAGWGAPRQAVVYSFITDAGRNLALPTEERPARCALGSAGYHEWGGIRAGEKPMKKTEIEPLVRAALRVNAYLGLMPRENPDLVIEFHWGCMRPDRSGTSNGRHGEIVNLADMLDLVGGRGLEFTNNRILRAALMDAALEERYFLILSAFESVAYARNRKQLLWRTQISVPIPNITQEQAFPILAACGATFFGRSTREPRLIDVDVEGISHALPKYAPQQWNNGSPRGQAPPGVRF
jgi:hypothetical protein